MTALLDAFVERSKEILREQLCGIYLHGSAVMGCFNPAKSDVDLIVVVKDELSDETKRAFMDMTVALNAAAPPKGIEMSVVLRSVCGPFEYPTPYELHFSAGHLAWYRADPDGYIRDMNGDDPDLAAHFTVIRARGRCLYGPPIEDVFGEVPKRDYLDSIWNDVADAREDIAKYPLYLTLNLARVLACCREERVLSKKEGGEWALDRLPAEFHPLLRAALKEYTRGEAVEYDLDCARRYADYMLRQIASEQAR